MISRLLSPTLLIGALLAIWELACRALHVPAYLLPAPSAIGAALAEGWPLLLASAWATLSTALVGLLIASLWACALALLVSLSRALEDAVRPIAAILQVTPLVAIGPLVTIWAGIESPQRAVSAWRRSRPSSRSSRGRCRG